MPAFFGLWPPSALNALGAATAASMAVTGALSAASAAISGALTAASVTATGAVSASVLRATPLAVAYASAITLDVGANNDFVIGLLTGDTTISFTGVADGRQGSIYVRQDTTGGRLVTWSAPGGRTLMKPSALSIAAATGVSTVTEFAYAFHTVGGLAMLRICKQDLVAGP